MPSNETDTGNNQTGESPKKPDLVESEEPQPDGNPVTEEDSTAAATASGTENEAPETVDEQVKTPKDEIMNEGNNDSHQENAMAVDDHELNMKNKSQEDTTAEA